MQDVRGGLRQLRRGPALAASAILTIALAIGLLTSIFSIVRALLLSPLPVTDASRLVVPMMQQAGDAGYSNVPVCRIVGLTASATSVRQSGAARRKSASPSPKRPERVDTWLAAEDSGAGGQRRAADHRPRVPRRRAHGGPCRVTLIASRLWKPLVNDVGADGLIRVARPPTPSSACCPRACTGRSTSTSGSRSERLRASPSRRATTSPSTPSRKLARGSRPA